MSSEPLILVLLATAILAVPSANFLDVVCERCDSWCAAEPTYPQQVGLNDTAVRGPVGPPGAKGEIGSQGLRGPSGDVGRKGSVGEPGTTDYNSVRRIIDRKIQGPLYFDELEEGMPYRTCRDARVNQAAGQSISNGLVNITIHGMNQTEVYCDFATDGGDWIVFQRRMDGSVDFYRDWDDYVNGFGDKEGEFWLGLEALHRLTGRGKWEMRTDMITVFRERLFVKYNQFRIGPASDKYRIQLSQFFGNTTNAIKLEHANQQFSTRNSDNDKDAKNCAVEWHGAWWYNSCGNLHSNLNGLYGSRDFKGLSWFRPTLGWTIMRYTEMKIRPQFPM